MKSLIKHTAAGVLVLVLCAASGSLLAFAQSNETEIVIHADNTADGSDSRQESNVSVEEPVGLTPEGKGTLVDNVYEDPLQFITVKTRNGQIFYLIIDRSEEKETENVYFLNEVDTGDLLYLMDDAEEERFEDAIESISGNKTDLVETISETPAYIAESESAEEPEVTSAGTETAASTSGSNSLSTPLIFLLICAAALGSYYFFKFKPMREAKAQDELDFEDDDEWIDEETENEYQDDEDDG